MKQYIIIGVLVAITVGIFYINQVRLENALAQVEVLEEQNQLLNDTLLEIDRQTTIINRNVTTLNEKTREIQQVNPTADIQNFDTKPLPELQKEVQDSLNDAFRRLEEVTK